MFLILFLSVLNSFVSYFVPFQKWQLIRYNKFVTKILKYNQPPMLASKRQLIFAEDAQIDETNVLTHPNGTEVRVQINVENSHKEEDRSAGRKKRRLDECLSLIYTIIAAFFLAFFLVEAISLMTHSMSKRQTFSQNLQTLKQSNSIKSDSKQAQHTFPQGFNDGRYGQNIPKVYDPQGISLQVNMAKVQLILSEKPTQNINDKVRYIIPQNNYAPHVPPAPKIIPQETLNQVIPVQQIQASTTQIQTQNDLFENKPNQTFTPPVQTILNQNKFQSLGWPQSEPSMKVQPTIFPFNDVSNDLSANNITFEGEYASISNQQMAFARQLRQIFDVDPQSAEMLAKKEKDFYERRYSISKYEQLPFCIVVPTFNNAARNRYLKNIKSIIMQQYSNFHVVIIDDKSEDGTGSLITKYLDSQQILPSVKYQIIINTDQRMAMQNLRTAAKEHCKPQQIFLIVDGDDELVGRQVLKLFNAVFQQKKLWFVYSNFLSTSGGVGYSRAFPSRTIELNNYRKYPFITSHLRAFYTKLFTKVKEQDLKDASGEYFKAANDVAICLPILEQAHQRVGYLPELTYYYNSNTGINNHILRFGEQRTNDLMIRQRQSYKRPDNLMD